jgi:hypothetical protein
VWADEMIGSAAFWWAAAIGDEIFTPVRGQIGSIGARGGHISIAEALKKDGVEPTFFVWPDAGKIAFAPELPLSEEGARRGDRDVQIAGEAFAAAVAASPIGQRNGLTREVIVSLSADVLTGQAAVDAGIADGVSTADEVIAYALSMAERAQGEKSTSAARARSGGSMPKKSKARSRAEDERYEDPPASEEERHAGEEPEEEEEEDKEKKDAEEDEPTSEEEHEAEDPPPSSRPPPRKMSSDATMSEILGLPAGASLPAQRTAAIQLRQIRDHAAQLTGQQDAAAILGGLTAIAHDASRSTTLRAQLDKVTREQTAAERMTLARRLAALGIEGHERGRIFVDAVNSDGTRKMRDGRPVARLAPMYAEMKIGTLRGMVESFERRARPRDPYQPSEEAAKSAARTGGLTKDARLERAKSNPHVKAMFDRAGNTLTLDQLAASFVAADFDLQTGA